MYLGYLQDRKLLGYPALKDTSCGIKLVLITDQTVLLIRNLPSNVKGKSKRIMVVICLEVLLIFGNVAPAEAKGDWFLLGAEEFTPPISRPVQSSRGYSGSKPASGQNPGKGGSGGNPNPSSESGAGSCSSNPTPKATPELMD